jgi:lysophospholipase L1-like esterase
MKGRAVVASAAVACALGCSVVAVSAGRSQTGSPAGDEDDGVFLRADARERGHIRLRLHSPAGVAVTITEATAGGAEPVASFTPTQADTDVRPELEWRCDRTLRSFTATTADGRSALTEVRTPSCRRRLRLVAASRARVGRRVRVRIVDKWGIGDLAVTVCVDPPGGPRRCRGRRLPDGAARLVTRFRALRPGGWRVRVRTTEQRLARGVRVRHPGGRVTVLATGDSMIQVLDGFLERRLAPSGVRVRSDARISSGISKPSGLDWQAHARLQADRIRPDVTVVFLGANDGFPMAGADCCGPAWVSEYARRARRMMLAYGRGGRGRVYWLLLPAARRGFFRETFPAVNAALRLAAAGARRYARLIDLDRVFTPGGRYRDTMRIHGRKVRVRQRDGVHLSVAGAALAARIVIRTLRAERILR